MEQWMKKLSGAVIASVLALTLSSKASADLLEDDTDPDQPVPQLEENIGEETPSPTREVPASGDENGEDDNGESDGPADSGEAGVITLSNTEDPGDVTEFTPGEDPSVNLSTLTEDQYDRIGFDAGENNNNDNDPADDCFYMVDFDGSDYDLTSENSDINIKAAGLNRLHGIKADGNVNLTGTGILLVDSIELSAGCEFYLHPIEGLYSSGGVAVFLRQSEAGEGTNAVYSMINGKNAPGILDEEYVIPEGIDLVLPSGNTLILQSVVQETVPEHMEEIDGEEVSVPEEHYTYTYEPDYSGSNQYTISSSMLSVPETSVLKVEKGASISTTSVIDQGAFVHRSWIEVNGTLANYGCISGSGIINFNAGSSAEGSGTFDENFAETGTGVFSNSIIKIDTQNIGITVDGSTVYIGTRTDSDISIDGLILKSDSHLCCSAGTSIGTVILSDGAEATFSTDEVYCSNYAAVFRNAIMGSGSLSFISGNYLVSSSSFVLDPAVSFSVPNRPVMINDISGMLASAERKDLAIVVDPDNTTMPSTATIPVLVYAIRSGRMIGGAHTWYERDSTEHKEYSVDLSPFGSSVPLSELADTDYLFIEIYTVRNGLITRHFYSNDEAQYSDTPFDPNEIWLIRLLDLDAVSNTGSGGSVMSTETSITGSGILGGQGAGSISGSGGPSIFSGTGITDPNNDNGNGSDNNRSSGPQQNLVVTVTEQSSAQSAATSLEELAPVYTLSVSSEGRQLDHLNGSVTVRVSCPAPKTTGLIFAVFRTEEGSLKAFAARYDSITGQLVFQCDMLGDFAVVCIDYKDELYTDEFYAFLETFASVRSLN